MTTITATDCSRLLSMLRLNTGPRSNIGLVSVEILLLLADHERLSTADLITGTGATDGQVSRGARLFLVWFDKKAGVVRKPELYLIQRRRKGKQYWFHLTSKGRALLRQAGVMNPCPGT